MQHAWHPRSETLRGLASHQTTMLRLREPACSAHAVRFMTHTHTAHLLFVAWTLEHHAHSRGVGKHQDTATSTALHTVQYAAVRCRMTPTTSIAHNIKTITLGSEQMPTNTFVVFRHPCMLMQQSAGALSCFSNQLHCHTATSFMVPSQCKATTFMGLPGRQPGLPRP